MAEERWKHRKKRHHITLDLNLTPPAPDLIASPPLPRGSAT